jgi:hypothetical protein
MIMGQSAGVAASLAMGADVSVQDIDMDKLRQHLVTENQVLYP